MKVVNKKPMKWWMWVLAFFALPLSLTIWVWKKENWSQSKRLKVIAGMWVVFLIIGALNGDFSEPAVQVSTNNTIGTSEPMKEQKQDENTIINQELHEDRKDYDTNRGSNSEAAATAQALKDLAQIASPGTNFDAYIRLDAPDKANKKYELGGDKQEFKNEVSFVGLTIVIDSSVWSSASEDQKKNLLASWAKIMQNEYPNASGWMKVTNGLRDVAETNWLAAKYNRSPEIKLK